jgi:IS30 family transposase
LSVYDQPRVETLGTQVYFSDPYRSWQRGPNKNTNGFLRQYGPKKTDLKKVTDKDILKILEKLNNRPRRELIDQIPAKIMREYFLNIAD